MVSRRDPFGYMISIMLKQRSDTLLKNVRNLMQRADFETNQIKIYYIFKITINRHNIWYQKFVVLNCVRHIYITHF